MTLINGNNLIRSSFKINSALMGAALVTISLFYLMQFLVRNDLRPEPIRGSIKIEAITIPDTEPVIHIDPIKPEKIIDPPPIIEVPTVLSVEETGFNDGPIVVGPIKEIVGPEKTSFSIDNGNALVLRQVQPIYPTNALSRGIEGFVIVEFDINPAGIVVDPRVMYAEPENVFNNAALRAISRWTFSPKMEKGEEVYQYDERRRISFTINE